MKTRAFPAAAAVALCALAAPVSAQIIATSIPKEFTGKSGTTTAEKKWAFHIMGAPLAKWKYGEVYIGQIDPSVISVGTVEATPNSDFLFAGEVAFKAGENWSIGIGGWYNKIGQTPFTFQGDNASLQDGQFFALDADLDGDVDIVEGHLGIFYKDFGVQGGIVKTSGSIGTNATLNSITFQDANGNPLQTINCASTLSPEECRIPVTTFESDTTDWDLFLVYKHAWGGSLPVGLSLGAGVYGKQGISEESPLRSSDSATVFSGFATANIQIWKGFGIDTSYWYIDKTDAFSGENALGGRSKQTDSQYRFTVGIGYTFSK